METATLITSHSVDEQQLAVIDLPERTKSYVPVSHKDFVDNIKDMASKLLPLYDLDTQKFGLAREGKQMFGTLTYKKMIVNSLEPTRDMGLSIGMRNSYDKSMSLGICSGSTVFVCENLMMSGEIVVMRTHRGRILDELKGIIFNAIVNAEHKFETLNADAQSFKTRDCDDHMAYGTIGRLYGNGILRERQLPVVKKEWNKPTHDAFSEKTLWRLYNAGTEALKTTPPMLRMNKQIKLHEAFKTDFGIA